MNTPQSIDLEQAIVLARTDLAQRLSISDTQIQLSKAEAVTWRDSSLGCPKPGMMYMQVLVDGFLIELRVEQTKYRYHGSHTKTPFLCADS